MFLYVRFYRKGVDTFSPEQYLEVPQDERSRQAFALYRSRYAGTLAMATGGCARYVFCTDVSYCLDRRGFPLIHYSSPNPHHHLILNNTTMTLRIPHRVDAEGNEHSILILTGMLELVDPGDHDSLDRHHRFFSMAIENYTRGANRLYRLVADSACFEMFSGQRLALDLDQLCRKNPLTGREEEQLVARLNEQSRQRKQPVAGVDAHGIDKKSGSSWVFHPFAEPLQDKTRIESAALQLLDTDNMAIS